MKRHMPYSNPPCQRRGNWGSRKRLKVDFLNYTAASWKKSSVSFPTRGEESQWITVLLRYLYRTKKSRDFKKVFLSLAKAMSWWKNVIFKGPSTVHPMLCLVRRITISSMDHKYILLLKYIRRAEHQEKVFIKMCL